MKYEFHPAAESEHLETVAYYESKVGGLGASYLTEFQAAVNRILQEPAGYQIAKPPNIRKANLRRFPFAIIYRSKGAAVQLLAISHFHRRPEHWAGRL